MKDTSDEKVNSSVSQKGLASTNAPWCGTASMREAAALRDQVSILRINVRAAIYACEILQDPKSSDAWRRDARSILETVLRDLRSLEDSPNREVSSDP